MKKTLYAAATAVLFFSIAPLAFATITVNPDAPTTPQPQFGFYCSPYDAPFVEGSLYAPSSSNNTCTYLLPAQQMASSSIFLAVYAGTPGNATLEDADFTTFPGASVIETLGNDWSGNQGDNFFSVAIGYDNFSDVLNENSYLTGGGNDPGIPYSIVQWKWGVAPQPVDTTPPSVTITTPLSGSTYLQNDTVLASANITDASSTIATTTYALDGQTVDPTQPLPLTSVSQGNATLVISATDSAGNTGYATSTFTIAAPDLTAPTITVTSPQVGATYMDNAVVPLTATVTDASGVAATSYTFDGQTVDPTQPLPLKGATLGPANVTVEASDKYGNVASTTVNFTIKSSDVTPPTIVISTPIANHTYLNTDSVTPAVNVSDASGIATSSATLGGFPVSLTSPLPLSSINGTTTFTVSATDNFGNATSSSVTFFVKTPPPPDTTPPSITITSPVSGHLYERTDSVYLTATITDQSAIANTEYFFDGKQIDPTKPLPLSTATLGDASTTVVAKDAFGNVGSSTISFRIEPSVGACLADVLDAFNHKLIPNAQTFAKLVIDCADIIAYYQQLQKYQNDDNQHHTSCTLDPRYIDAQNNFNNAYQDIDGGIYHH